ncbi:hypothetical protein OE88DRAFT_1714124 [Heliocybe sulcata]|uniref:DUF7598 domain-containing protein n=1 Tax=Heliocybe sulcata TaxID=5364 RepID=A0A5C3MS81_9AGAM|nr:hypothetical protein OE88DRAFT_1714124 [Heliocybe sulcata]
MLPPRAYVFIGLNIVRILSIIALLLLFASSIFTMVNDVETVDAFIAAKQTNATFAANMANYDYFNGSTVPNQSAGPAFAVVNRLLIIFQVIVLFLSEIGWPIKLFDNYFPILGSKFGVGPLGTIQCLIGAAVLSHHVDDFSLVSAFFLFALGCLNIVVGLIWRASVKPKRCLTAWKERAKDVLPPPVTGLMNVVPSFVSNHFAGPERPMSPEEVLATRPGFGFGRQGEKKAALKGFFLSKPVESLPRYASKPSSAHESGLYEKD